MPNILVSDYLKEKLEEVRNRNGHSSFDSVIRSLYLKDKGVSVSCSFLSCGYNKEGKCGAETINLAIMGAPGDLLVCTTKTGVVER